MQTAESTSLRKLAELIGQDDVEEAVRQIRAIFPLSSRLDTCGDLEDMAEAIVTRVDRLLPEADQTVRIQFAKEHLAELVGYGLKHVSDSTIH